jgi:hypothetical protein
MPSDQSLPGEPPPDPSDSVPETASPASSETDIKPVSSQPPPAETLSWWQVWLKALIHPTSASYQLIINNPGASLKRGLTWSFGASLIVSLMLWGAGVMRYAPLDSWRFHRDDLTVDWVILFLVVGVPVVAALATLIFALVTGITNILAKLLRGKGSYDRLVYASSAFTAPLLLITAAIAFIPYFNLVGLLAGLYTVYLEIVSVRVVHNFGWGKAIAIVLIPPCLIFSCCCLFSLTVLAPSGFFDGLQSILFSVTR